jgi:DNA-binding response OmpR family regulator
MRALIADTDPASIRLLGESLERLGHEVAIAHDGEEALRLYAKEPFPLVIADWQIPKMSGVELCRAIRRSARERHSYMVIATTLSDKQNILDGFYAGADDYLVKPFCVHQLEARIVAAERACLGDGTRPRITMRDFIEMCQSAAGEEGSALRAGVETLADRYETRRAHSKARTFLRREIVLTRRGAGARAEGAGVARLVRELELLHGLEDGTS